MIKCPECGSINLEDSRTCYGCGLDLIDAFWEMSVAESQRLHVTAEELASVELQEKFLGDELILGPGVWEILKFTILGDLLIGVIDGALWSQGMIGVIIFVFAIVLNVIVLVLFLNPKINWLKLNDEGFTIHTCFSTRAFKWSDISTIEVKRLYIPPFWKGLWIRFTDNYWNNIGRSRPRSLGLGEFQVTPFLMSWKPEKMLELFNGWKNKKSIVNEKGHRLQNTAGEDNSVPVEKYAKEKGLTSNETIQMIRDGKLVGFIKEEKWYVELRATP